MPFEWDEAKRENNLAKHGVDFRRAVQVFRGRVVERLDQRRSYGETRIRCVGEIDGRAYVVIYTWQARPGASSAQGKPMNAKPERIVRMTLEEARKLPDMTDYARLDAMTDEDIASAVAEDPDACPVDADWSDASLVVPPPMRESVLFVDADVLAWFRETGEGFRARMNAVLRAYIEAQQRKVG